jgi:hypothetical protein
MRGGRRNCPRVPRTSVAPRYLLQSVALNGQVVGGDISVRGMWAHCASRLTLLAMMAIASSPIARAGDIHIGTPLISGDVSRFADRQETGHSNLSSQQLQALAAWMVHHRSGWSGMVTAASLEPCALQVNLRHSDGATTSISVIAQANGGHYLRVSGPGKWAYEAFGGVFRSWAATRQVSDQELVALANLVSAT